MLLPFVKPEIGHSVKMDIIDQDDDSCIREQIKFIKEENPSLAWFIEQFAKTTKDYQGSALCAIMVYKLLRSQAEVDQMMEDIAL